MTKKHKVFAGVLLLASMLAGWAILSEHDPFMIVAKLLGVALFIALMPFLAIVFVDSVWLQSIMFLLLIGLFAAFVAGLIKSAGRSKKILLTASSLLYSTYAFACLFYVGQYY